MGIRSFLSRLFGARGVEKQVVVSTEGILVTYARRPQGLVESRALHAWDEVSAVRVFGRNLDDTDPAPPAWAIELRAGTPVVITNAFCGLEQVVEHCARLPGFDREEAYRAARTRAGEPEPYCWTRQGSAVDPLGQPGSHRVERNDHDD